MPETFRIRTANKALILDGDRLLVTVNRGPAGDEFYLCPGGGQEWGEDRVEGMRRECREEIGCDVEVLGLACLRSYIGRNHQWAVDDDWFHQEEAFWFCRLADGAQPNPGTLIDDWQIGVAWKTLDELVTGPFTPAPIIPWLRLPAAERPGYLGDCV